MDSMLICCGPAVDSLVSSVTFAVISYGLEGTLTTVACCMGCIDLSITAFAKVAPCLINWACDLEKHSHLCVSNCCLQSHPAVLSSAAVSGQGCVIKCCGIRAGILFLLKSILIWPGSHFCHPILAGCSLGHASKFCLPILSSRLRLIQPGFRPSYPARHSVLSSQGLHHAL